MVDTHNPKGWPRGAGSLQRRSNSLWLIYRDEDFVLRQENTRTDDLAKARRMLAARSIATLKARIAAIQKVVDETRETAPKAAAQSRPQTRGRAEHGASRGPVRNDATQRRNRGAAKRGGKR